MKTRVFLIIIQPALFLSACVGVYAFTGVGAILYVIAAVLFVIFTVIGLSIMLRKGAARCIHVQAGTLVIERKWPWEPITRIIDTITIRHVGGQLYRIESNGESIAFDKSVCSCMGDVEFAELCRDRAG